MALGIGDSPTPAALSVGARLSRATVQLAMRTLQDRYGLDTEASFEDVHDAARAINCGSSGSTEAGRLLTD